MSESIDELVREDADLTGFVPLDRVRPRDDAGLDVQSRERELMDVDAVRDVATSHDEHHDDQAVAWPGERAAPLRFAEVAIHFASPFWL